MCVPTIYNYNGYFKNFYSSSLWLRLFIVIYIQLCITSGPSVKIIYSIIYYPVHRESLGEKFIVPNKVHKNLNVLFVKDKLMTFTQYI